MNNTPLDKQLIVERLRTKYLGDEIQCFDVLESTNRTAHEFAQDGAPAGTVVLADEQTAGRGRRGRTWSAKHGDSMLMSVILRPALTPEHAPRYTQAAALGVLDALRLFRVPGARIKWPNDIVVYGRRKLSGILLECSAAAQKINYLIVGIGLNINSEDFDTEIADKATSMFCETRKKYPREPIIAEVLNSLEPLFDMCGTDAGFAEIMQKYTCASVVLNKRVSIVQGDAVHTGTVTGFDDTGRIELLSDGGERMVFDSGDVSLRYDF